MHLVGGVGAVEAAAVVVVVAVVDICPQPLQTHSLAHRKWMRMRRLVAVVVVAAAAAAVAAALSAVVSEVAWVSSFETNSGWVSAYAAEVGPL
jgi:hypothetical protein